MASNHWLNVKFFFAGFIVLMHILFPGWNVSSSILLNLISLSCRSPYQLAACANVALYLLNVALNKERFEWLTTSILCWSTIRVTSSVNRRELDTLPVMSTLIQNIIDAEPVPTNKGNVIVVAVISLEVFRKLIATAPIENWPSVGL